MDILTPRKALNKAYLKQKINRKEMERFKTNLRKMLSDMNPDESEEYHKNLLNSFLSDTWYKGHYFINTRERTDLVIHTNKKSESEPAVLIETKKPGNRNEMPSKDNINAKAVQELIRYYLHERIDNENLYVKHLIVTDLNEFFIFNENDFDQHIYRDKKIRDAYENYKNSDKDAPFFYEHIAKPLIDRIQDKFTVTWLDVKKAKRLLKTTDPEKEKQLVPYYKILSPAHLLKQPFANDSNTLDRNFYNELLHIIGLKEIKKGSQKLIQRAAENERQPGSLIENTINILDSEGILDFFKRKKDYGETREEQLFNIALELTITWINRILFLKLLEAQLVRYNRNDASFKFLNIETLPDYDALNKLFFQVLAVKPIERQEKVKEEFSKIPYLNSSLFDVSELEGNTIRISNLEDEYMLPYLKQTVLKDAKGKRRTGKLDALQYLFEFLDAYDFASEGSEEIQEENKNLINASVLGLIFEKINGYKEGSFFTPGFITEYMARETIKRAVVQKFNEEKGWELEDFEALKDKIDLGRDGRKEANRIINSLKICDPAVGSGHFLVSALNEMIALKSELRVLSYRDESRVKLYSARVENDELIVEDDDEGAIFEYGLSKQGTIIPEKQAVQEAIFHEKQTIIENCLFGVDINPNSVKICRLRLWIELLKHSYYHHVNEEARDTNNLELQTLPNIDINIKAGNSLISRFSLDTSLASALKRSSWKVEDYRKFVNDYKNAEGKDEKHGLQAMIDQIKKDFRTEINRDDPKQKRLNKLVNELHDKYTGNKLFEDKLTKKQKQDRAKLEKKINNLQAEIDDMKYNEIYRNAFEWRFEFPEVLDDKGNFMGFDLVIGNPPYVNFRDIKNPQEKNIMMTSYSVAEYQSDLFILFIELAYNILSYKGNFGFIVPNTLTNNLNNSKIRKFILKKSSINSIVNTPIGVFPDATVDTVVIISRLPKISKSSLIALSAENQSFNIVDEIKQREFENNENFFFDFLTTSLARNILRKIEKDGVILNSVCESSSGLKEYETGKGDPPQKREDKVNAIFNANTRIDESYRKHVTGGDITNYFVNWKGNYLKYGKCLAAPRESKYFEGPRVIIREIPKNGRLVAAYTEDEYTVKNTAHVFIPNSSYDGRYIVAILNSKLLSFYFVNKFSERDQVFPKAKIGQCRQLPIKSISLKEQQPFIEKVNQILQKKQQDPTSDTSTVEAEIDEMVYDLYGLTEEERVIVEKVGR